MPTVEIPPKSAADRVREVTAGQPVASGARLVKALRVSGTPDAKLRPARAALAAAGKDLPAADVVDALEAAAVSPATLAKAKALAATGQLPTREALRPIEDALLEKPAERPAGWKADPKK